MKPDADWRERLKSLVFGHAQPQGSCYVDVRIVEVFIERQLTAARADERKKMVDAVMRNDLLEEAANAVEQRFNHKTMTPKDAGVIDICAGVIRSLKQ